MNPHGSTNESVTKAGKLYSKRLRKRLLKAELQHETRRRQSSIKQQQPQQQQSVSAAIHHILHTQKPISSFVKKRNQDVKSSWLSAVSKVRDLTRFLPDSYRQRNSDKHHARFYDSIASLRDTIERLKVFGSTGLDARYGDVKAIPPIAEGDHVKLNLRKDDYAHFQFKIVMDKVHVKISMRASAPHATLFASCKQPQPTADDYSWTLSNKSASVLINRNDPEFSGDVVFLAVLARADVSVVVHVDTIFVRAGGSNNHVFTVRDKILDYVEQLKVDPVQREQFYEKVKHIHSRRKQGDTTPRLEVSWKTTGSKTNKVHHGPSLFTDPSATSSRVTSDPYRDAPPPPWMKRRRSFTYSTRDVPGHSSKASSQRRRRRRRRPKPPKHFVFVEKHRPKNAFMGPRSSRNQQPCEQQEQEQQHPTRSASYQSILSTEKDKDDDAVDDNDEKKQQVPLLPQRFTFPSSSEQNRPPLNIKSIDIARALALNDADGEKDDGVVSVPFTPREWKLHLLREMADSLRSEQQRQHAQTSRPPQHGDYHQDDAKPAEPRAQTSRVPHHPSAPDKPRPVLIRSAKNVRRHVHKTTGIVLVGHAK